MEDVMIGNTSYSGRASSLGKASPSEFGSPLLSRNALSPSGFPPISSPSRGLKKYALVPPISHVLFVRPDGSPEFADVYPHKPGEPEDSLSEEKCSKGYHDSHILQNESLAGFELIRDQLSESLFQSLSEFAGNLISRSSSNSAPQNAHIPISTSFKIPQRVVSLEQKRDQWVADLASDVPLSFLVRHVPHGFRGDRLLEVVYSKEVPIPRAIWFIRLVNLNEMGIKSKTVDLQYQYSTEWTTIVLQFVEKQLQEISTRQSQQSANPKLGMSRKASLPMKPVWITEDARTSFLLKWKYGIRFIRAQYDEGLVDKRVFIMKLLDLFRGTSHHPTSSAAKMSFLIPLVQAFLDEYMRSRTLMRHLLAICFSKLRKLRQVSNTKISTIIELQIQALTELIREILVSDLDIFVSPKLHPEIQEFRSPLLETRKETDSCMLEQQVYLQALFEKAQLRHARLLGPSQTKSSLTDLSKKLNKISSSQTVDGFFQSCVEEFPLTDEAIHFVINWALESIEACTLMVVPQLLARVVAAPLPEIGNLSPLQRVKSSPNRDRMCSLIQSFLMNYLDIHSPMQRLYILFSELENFGLFSINQAVQQMIATSDLDREKNTALITFVKDYPIPQHKTKQLSQRNMILAARTLQVIMLSKDEDTFNLCQKQIRAKLPHMFLPSSNQVKKQLDTSVRDSISDFPLSVYDTQLAKLLKEQLTPFYQVRLSQWLKDSVMDFVSKDQQIGLNNWKSASIPGHSLMNDRQVCFVISVFENILDFLALLEILLWFVQKTADKQILRTVIFTLERYQLTFECMGCAPIILTTLFGKLEGGKGRNAQLYGFFLKYLEKVSQKELYRATSEQKAKIDAAIKDMPKKKPKTTGASRDIPNEFRELRTISFDTSTISTIASTYAWKYVNHAQLISRLFGDMLHLVNKIGGANDEELTRERLSPILSHVAFYGELMAELHDRIPNIWDHFKSHFEHTYTKAPLISETDILVQSPITHIGSSVLLLRGLIGYNCIPLKDFISDIVLPFLSRAQNDVWLGSSKLATILVNVAIQFGFTLMITVSDIDADTPFSPCSEVTKLRQYVETVRNCDLKTEAVACSILDVLHRFRLLNEIARVKGGFGNELDRFVTVWTDSLLNRGSWLKELLLRRPGICEKQTEKWAQKEFKDVTSYYSPGSLTKTLRQNSTKDGCLVEIIALSDRLFLVFELGFLALRNEQVFVEVTKEFPSSDQQLQSLFSQLLSMIHSPSDFDRGIKLHSLLIAYLFLNCRLPATSPSSIVPSVSWDSVVHIWAKEWLVFHFHQRTIPFHDMELLNTLESDFIQCLLKQLSTILICLDHATNGKWDIISNEYFDYLDFTKHLVADTRKFRILEESFDRVIRFELEKIKPRLSSNASDMQSMSAKKSGSQSEFSGINDILIELLKVLEEGLKWYLNYREENMLPDQVLIPGEQTEDLFGLEWEKLHEMLLFRINIVRSLATFLSTSVPPADYLQIVCSLTLLLNCPLVHNHGEHSDTFDYVFDLVSWLIDEMPRDLNKDLLTWLRDHESELDIPTVFRHRVSKIFPFQLNHKSVDKLWALHTDGGRTAGSSASSSNAPSPAHLPDSWSTSPYISNSHLTPGVMNTMEVSPSHPFDMHTPGMSSSAGLTPAPLAEYTRSFLPVQQRAFKPWDWLEEWDTSDATQPNQALFQQMPLSIAYFGARKLDHLLPNPLSSIWAYGWRPPAIPSGPPSWVTQKPVEYDTQGNSEAVRDMMVLDYPVPETLDTRKHESLFNLALQTSISRNDSQKYTPASQADFYDSVASGSYAPTESDRDADEGHVQKKMRIG